MFSAAMDRARIAIVAGIVLVLTGCNSIGAGKQLKQLELENNRLLSEFRAERQRRESAERTAQQLENRLAESEKMLARQLQGPAGSGRLSSLPMPSSASNANSAAFPSTSPLDGLPSLSSPSASGAATSSGDLRWHRRK